MRHVPIAELKDHLSAVIAAAAKGEEIVITRHGKATVKIVSVIGNSEARRAKAREAFARMAQVRQKMRAEGRTSTIEEMIAWKNEGRP
ncbi:MAG: type II toxin-antitoxin system prevent-host-death family antitoxin [Sphingomicrobium sp.]